MSGLDENGNYKDIVGQLRDVTKIETGMLYSRRLMLNLAADEIDKLRDVLRTAPVQLSVVAEVCPRLGLPHQYWPQGNCQYCGKLSPVEEEIERVVQSVNEWDDRTSPDDYPEHLLITSEELADLLRNFAAVLASTEGTEG